LNGKRILITGATDGIGKQTALELSSMGACVIIHARDLQRGEQTRREISQISGNQQVELVIADLSSLRQVREMAVDIQKRFPRLDVLINNAGTYMRKRVITEDGFEMTFVVNYLAAFLLTNLLLELLKTSAPSRVVNVSSVAHAQAILDYKNLQGERLFSGWQAYAISKLGNVVFTYELSTRMHGMGVTVNCLHPGVIKTKLLRKALPFLGSSMVEGAKTSVYLASAPELCGISGKYFINNQEKSSSRLTYNLDVRKYFWEISARMTGIQP